MVERFSYSYKVATLDIHPTPRHHKPIGSITSCNWIRVYPSALAVVILQVKEFYLGHETPDEI
jgi:hypothetical protein